MTLLKHQMLLLTMTTIFACTTPGQGKDLLQAIETQNFEKMANLLRQNQKLVYSAHPLFGTPLHFAVIMRSSRFTEFLIEQGAPISSPASHEEGTPLHLACKHGCLEIVKLLLKLGADIEAQDARRLTPLHYAISFAHLTIAKVLLKHDADTEVLDDRAFTPLSYALPGKYTFTKLLINHGAAVTPENERVLDSFFPRWRGEKHTFENNQKQALMANVSNLPEVLAEEIIRYAYQEINPRPCTSVSGIESSPCHHYTHSLRASVGRTHPKFGP